MLADLQRKALSENGHRPVCFDEYRPANLFSPLFGRDHSYSPHEFQLNHRHGNNSDLCVRRSHPPRTRRFGISIALLKRLRRCVQQHFPRNETTINQVAKARANLHDHPCGHTQMSHQTIGSYKEIFISLLLGLAVWATNAPRHSMIPRISGERQQASARSLFFKNDLLSRGSGGEAAVRLMKTPNGGIQQQAVIDERGRLHLIYYVGEPFGGAIYYVRREAGEETFSTPIRINSQPSSAIAFGTMRGAHIAVGKKGRVHVAWNGSITAEPRGPKNSDPMLYARMNDAGDAFEAQRNLMRFSSGLDGGGSIAADKAGNVYVVWHGDSEKKEEQHRRVWLARSTDGGKTFAREASVLNEETGASGSCGMRAFVDRRGAVYLLYRTATDLTNRGMFLLVSTDRGRSFRGLRVDEWNLAVCPMSTAAMTTAQNDPKTVLAVWENNRQVYFAALDPKALRKPIPIAAPGETGRRRHAAIAMNTRGETILVWIEVKGWNKDGAVAWQVFDRNGKPAAEKGIAPGAPVWGLGAVVAEADGRFTIFY